MIVVELAVEVVVVVVVTGVPVVVVVVVVVACDLLAMLTKHLQSHCHCRCRRHRNRLIRFVFVVSFVMFVSTNKMQRTTQQKLCVHTSNRPSSVVDPSAWSSSGLKELYQVEDDKPWSHLYKCESVLVNKHATCMQL